MITSEFDINTAVYGMVKDNHYDLAILPWGATEPHGYHLPYGTDNLIINAISWRLAEESAGQGVNAMVLPCIPFGPQNQGQVQLPFCLNASTRTLGCILEDVVLSLRAQGIDKLLLMIGHGGESDGLKAFVRDFAIKYPDFTIVTNEYWKICRHREEIFEEKIDDHAGEEETSLMLYFYPELVRTELEGTGKSCPFAIEGLNRGIGWMPRIWNKASVDTGIGNPHKASAQKAERYLAQILPPMVKLVVDLASKIYIDSPYFSSFRVSTYC